MFRVFYAINLTKSVMFYRVTDEALIAETAVWPNFFLMNIFFALKGSKLFIIIYLYMKQGYICHFYVLWQVTKCSYGTDALSVACDSCSQCA